jgi:LysM repeat protein
MASTAAEHATALKNLEAMIADQTSRLTQTAPKQLQEMKALLAEMKRSPTGQISAAAQKTLRNLFVWQLDLKRVEYLKRIAALDAAAKTDPKAAKAQKALKHVMAVLEEAKKAMSLPANVSAQLAKQIEVASDRARASLLEFTKVPEPVATPKKANAPDPDATPAPLAKTAAAKAPAPGKAPVAKGQTTSKIAAPTWVASRLDPKNGKK